MSGNARHSIRGTDDLLRSTIIDQASDIEHAWREALQNATDAPESTEAHLWYDRDRSIITDNGIGLNLNKQEGVNLTTDMGKSSKDEENNSSIGQFGVGMGQIFAMGRVTVFSRGVALHFDIRNWGIKDSVVKTTVPESKSFLKEHDDSWANHVEEGIKKSLDGTTIIISHYESQMPDNQYNWSSYESRIAKRFKFIDTYTDFKIYVNNELICDSDISEHLRSATYDTTESLNLDSGTKVKIYLKQGTSESIEVYSNGVYVKDSGVDELSGFSGVVITDSNLKLNFARNEIKSGCPIWNQTRKEIIDISLDLADSIPDSNLNDEARTYMAQRLLDNPEEHSEWSERNLFESPSESYYTLNQIQSREEIGFDNRGSRAADKIEEATNKIILSTDDPASSKYKDTMDSIEESPDVFSIDEVAESRNLFQGEEVFDVGELTPRQRNKLGVARELASRMGIGREIRYGESGLSHAWTDSHSYIVITDSATPSGNWNAWVHELYQTLVHEFSHIKSTKGSHPSHGRMFDSRFRENIEQYTSELTDLIEDINSNGIRYYRVNY